MPKKPTFIRYSQEQRAAFVAAAVKVRAKGGTWPQAVEVVRPLGFLGNEAYLRKLLVKAGHEQSRIPKISANLQQRLKASYDLLVARGLAEHSGVTTRRKNAGGG